MTKEEIKTFIEKYSSINVNEIIEVFLKDRTSLIGFFDLQELKNEQQNKWTFANVFNYNKTILNGENILKIYFYRDGEKLEDDGIEIKYNSDGTYTIV
jgi:hypothetical protein